MKKDEPLSYYDVTEGIASPETQKKYAYHFRCFLGHFEGITPESLLQMDVKTIEAMIIQWTRYLSQSRNQKYGTIHHEVAAVIHFFDWNDVRLNKHKVNRSIPEDEEVRHYSHQEIQQILRQCDERGKVMVLLMASTGLRIGALPGLRFGDLTHIPEYDLYKIQVYARTKDSHYSFCTPECKKAIDEHRIFREVHGETISEDSPLIRELFDTRVRFAAGRSRPMKIQGLETLMHRVLKRSEVRVHVEENHGGDSSGI
jgi:integrase